LAHVRIEFSLLSLILLSLLLAMASLVDVGGTAALNFVGWYLLIGLGLYHLLHRISRRTREEVK